MPLKKLLIRNMVELHEEYKDFLDNRN